MHIVISQANGQRAEGVLLAAGRNCLRVMLPGALDIIELNNDYGQWRSEAGQPVELESLFAEPALDVSLFSRQVFPLARTAGTDVGHC